MADSTQTIQTHLQETHLSDYQIPSFFVDEVYLDFELHEAKTRVSSILRVRKNRQSKNITEHFILDGEALELESVRLNGVPLSEKQYKVTENKLIIFNAPTNFELSIKTVIYPQQNTELSGLYRSHTTYCTQCEAEGFRRITYFPDRPDILSRFTTTIHADKDRYPYLLSNGNLIAHGEENNHRHFATWQDPFKKPCYLFALVAGDFDLLEDQFVTQSQSPVALKIYVEKGYLNEAHHAMEALKLAMRWDEVSYGREYDLDVYMIVAIADFNMGAMENKGLNIFNTKYILAKPETATDEDYIHILSVIGHEYFHNWSGNRVTCRDWFQLSLKEGLTIFRDQSFTEDILSATVMRIRDVNYLREHQFPEDAGPLAHPVRPDAYIEINNFYTATIYHKGAEVLRMLQTILGKQLFRKGMDLYFAQYDGQAVTIEDFIKVMEDISGIDLQLFRRWYTQAGTPQVSVQEDYDYSQQIYTLTLKQICAPTPHQEKKSPFMIPVKMGLLNESGEAIPLQFSNETPSLEKLLILDDSSKVFQFKNVKTKPIPSLFRNFSAPVKFDYRYSNATLHFLAQYDTDPFNRFEARLHITLQVLLSLVNDVQHELALKLDPDFSKLWFNFNEIITDLLLQAEMFKLPSEKYIGDQCPIVEVEAIHTAREFALSELAISGQKNFLHWYERYHHTEPYVFNLEKVGARQLKNAALTYLMRLKPYQELGLNQFKDSLNKNMTDTEAALICIAHLDLPEKKESLDQFYQRWKNDPLAIDKWLAIQAAAPTLTALEEVRKLTRHSAFDLKNPNKVYALIGTFCQRNLVNFHLDSGEGYAFLREMVEQLDRINPQIAARMLTPLTQLKRYDHNRQSLMRHQLEQLLTENKLSKDVYELVIKSLEALA